MMIMTSNPAADPGLEKRQRSGFRWSRAPRGDAKQTADPAPERRDSSCGQASPGAPLASLDVKRSDSNKYFRLGP